MTGLLVNIDVDDIDKAIAFYRDGLGLAVGRRFGTDFAEMLGATSPIYLLAKPAGSAPFKGGAARDYGRHWTPVHLDFPVTDIKAAVARARDAGAQIEADIRTAKWGHMALLSDPFGNGFCLLEFVGRGYDEITG
jgi:predicted enzyme related to lactoylglutathione lyase